MQHNVTRAATRRLIVLAGREGVAGRLVRRVSGAAEAPLMADLRVCHEDVIEWRREQARFVVDSAEVLAVPDPPGAAGVRGVD